MGRLPRRGPERAHMPQVARSRGNVRLDRTSHITREWPDPSVADGANFGGTGRSRTEASGERLRVADVPSTRAER